MEFSITLEIGGKSHRLPVKYLGTDEKFERYQVTGRKGIIIVQNNRPALKASGIFIEPFWSMENRPAFEWATLVQQIGGAIDAYLKLHRKVILISPVIEGAIMNLEASYDHTDEKFEYYKIRGNNVSMIIKNNRPILKSLGKEHTKLHWTMQGFTKYQDFLQMVSMEIENELKRF